VADPEVLRAVTRARVHTHLGSGEFVGVDKQRSYSHQRGRLVWEYWAIVRLDDGRTVRVPWVNVHEQVGKT
jgi:hypothetical protein